MPMMLLNAQLDVSFDGPKAFVQMGHMSLGRECADVAPLKAALPEALKRISQKPRFDLPLLRKSTRSPLLTDKPSSKPCIPCGPSSCYLPTRCLSAQIKVGRYKGRGLITDWLDYSVVLQIMIDSVNDLRRVILTTIASEYAGRSLGIVKLPTFDGGEKINGPGFVRLLSSAND